MNITKKMNLQFLIGIFLLVGNLYPGSFGKGSGIELSDKIKQNIVLGTGKPIIKASVTDHKGEISRVSYFNVDNNELTLTAKKSLAMACFALEDLKSIEICFEHDNPKLITINEDGIKNSGFESPAIVYIEVKIKSKRGTESTYMINKNTYVSGYLEGTDRSVVTWYIAKLKKIVFDDEIDGYVSPEPSIKTKRKGKKVQGAPSACGQETTNNSNNKKSRWFPFWSNNQG